MARLMKDASSKPPKAASDLVIKGPSKTLIIPDHELVQVLAKVLFHTLCFDLRFSVLHSR